MDKYTITLGIPDRNRIIYDGLDLKLEVSCDDVVYLLLLNRDLRLNVNCKDGKIMGIKGRIGDILSLPDADIALPHFIDGSVVFHSYTKFLKHSDYVINFSDNLRYDRNKNALLVGIADSSMLTIRVAQNVYILSDENCIGGILIYPLFDQYDL